MQLFLAGRSLSSLSLEPREAAGCILCPNPNPPSLGHLRGAAAGCSQELQKDQAAAEGPAALTQTPSLLATGLRGAAPSAPFTTHPAPVQSFEASKDHVRHWKLLAQVTGVSCESQGQRARLERTRWLFFFSLPPQSQEMKDKGQSKPAHSHPSFPCWSVNPPTHTSLYLTHCNQSYQIPS